MIDITNFNSRQVMRDYDLNAALSKAGFSSNMQIEQKAINDQIMRRCGPVKPNRSIKESDYYTDAEMENRQLMKILPHIIHKDTRFGETGVRIQGLLHLDYLDGKNILPTSDYQYIKGTNYLYISSLGFSYLK